MPHTTHDAPAAFRPGDRIWWRARRDDAKERRIAALVLEDRGSRSPSAKPLRIVFFVRKLVWPKDAQGGEKAGKPSFELVREIRQVTRERVTRREPPDRGEAAPEVDQFIGRLGLAEEKGRTMDWRRERAKEAELERGLYLPSQAEIAAGCAEIQATWPKEQREPPAEGWLPQMVTPLYGDSRKRAAE